MPCGQSGDCQRIEVHKGDRLMSIKEMIEKCGKLNFYEKRTLTDDCGDFVVLNEEMEKLNQHLAKYLNPPIKPAGVAPTKADIKLTNYYGGIQKQQTLYLKNNKQDAILAMCWPWSNGSYITIKMFRLSTDSYEKLNITEDDRLSFWQKIKKIFK